MSTPTSVKQAAHGHHCAVNLYAIKAPCIQTSLRYTIVTISRRQALALAGIDRRVVSSVQVPMHRCFDTQMGERTSSSRSQYWLLGCLEAFPRGDQVETGEIPTDRGSHLTTKHGNDMGAPAPAWLAGKCSPLMNTRPEAIVAHGPQPPLRVRSCPPSVATAFATCSLALATCLQTYNAQTRYATSRKLPRRWYVTCLHLQEFF